MIRSPWFGVALWTLGALLATGALVAIPDCLLLLFGAGFTLAAVGGAVWAVARARP